MTVVRFPGKKQRKKRRVTSNKARADAWARHFMIALGYLDAAAAMAIGLKVQRKMFLEAADRAFRHWSHQE